MKNEATTLPILSIGNFGLHIIKNPAGTFSFVGTVPSGLNGIISTTEKEAENAFAAWFNSLPVSDRRNHVGDLRNDIFEAVMNVA